jgi:hypothetical protein
VGKFLSDLGVKMIMPEGQLLSSALCLNHWQKVEGENKLTHSIFGRRRRALVASFEMRIIQGASSFLKYVSSEWPSWWSDEKLGGRDVSEYVRNEYQIDHAVKRNRRVTPVTAINRKLCHPLKEMRNQRDSP